jgi:hypothetical protein
MELGLITGKNRIKLSNTDVLEWSNSALQHKGFGRIAGKLSEKIGYSFNYTTKAYELN